MSGKMPQTIVIPNDVFFASVCESLAEGRPVTFTVKGYSMFPFMRNEKDRVCLERYDGRMLAVGEVILFRYHGKHILHRIYSAEMSPGGRPLYRTMGDGNVRGVEYARPEDISGVMLKRITPAGNEWYCNSASWKRASSLWMRLLPVRRLLLAVLRRIRR